MATEPTPAKVLTKSQMKRAARENKVRTRNVLFNPFRLEWPPVSREAAAAVLAAVDSQFDQFDIPSGVPQSEYTALLAAGDRAGITARRREIRAAAEPLLAARRAHLAHCVLGFNAASRALESGRLACLLVEADTPALETRLLLPLAAGRSCPAVCLPRLRPALQRRLGLQTAVLGLTEEVLKEGHHLRRLYEAVCAAASPLIPRRFTASAAAGSKDSADTASTAPAAEEVDQSAAGGNDENTAASENTDQMAQDAKNGTASKNQTVTAPSSVSTAPPSPPPKPSPSQSPSPVPFEQADFISLSASPPSKRRADRQPDRPLLDLISIDTEGVPHRKRLQLKKAPVMQVTLGNKAKKRAARAAAKAALKEG